MEAARLLNVGKSTVCRKIKECGLSKANYGELDERKRIRMVIPPAKTEVSVPSMSDCRDCSLESSLLGLQPILQASKASFDISVAMVSLDCSAQNYYSRTVEFWNVNGRTVLPAGSVPSPIVLVDGSSLARKVVPNRVSHLESGVALVMSKIPDCMLAADALVRRVPVDDDDEDDDEERRPEEDEDEGDDENEGDEGDGYSE